MLYIGPPNLAQGVKFIIYLVLLPVQLAGVKGQKMELYISNDGLNQNFLPVTINYFGKLRIELQTLNYYVFDPIQTPISLPTPPDYVHLFIKFRRYFGENKVESVIDHICINLLVPSVQKINIGNPGKLLGWFNPPPPPPPPPVGLL